MHHAKTSTSMSVVGGAQEMLRCGGYVASRVFRILKALQSDAAKGKEVERLLRQFPAWDPYKALRHTSPVYPELVLLEVRNVSRLPQNTAAA